MKFSINQSELLNALAVVSKGISARASLPVLAGVYIKAAQDRIVFQSTNQTLSVKYTAAALIEEEGETVIPGKLFLDIVKSLSDVSITVEVDSSVATIVCDNAHFQIKVLDAQDFPQFPEVEKEASITVPFDTFSSMIKQVGKAVSKDESRAILTGILVKAENQTLEMVATDSYRLAIFKSPVEGLADFNAVIAGAFMQDIASLKKIESDITVSMTSNQVIIEYGNIVFINRRIEGNYPNYKQLLPKAHTLHLEIPTDKLISAVKRASILSTISSSVKCSYDPEEEMLTISGASQDIGSAEESIPVEGTGEAMDIAFNCGYFLEGLMMIKTEKAVMELQSPLHPGIIRSQAPQDYLYLIMPVRII